MKGTRDRTVLLGMGSALVAAIAYAMVSVLVRVVVTSRAEPLVTMTFASVFGVALLGVLFHRDLARDRKAMPRPVALSAVAGLIGVISLTALFTALQNAPVVVVTPIVGTFPVPALVLARLFLGHMERVTLNLAVGTALVVVGVVLISLASAGR